MKLNQFFKKDKAPKAQKAVYKMGNEAKEAALQSQITELTEISEAHQELINEHERVRLDNLAHQETLASVVQTNTHLQGKIDKLDGELTDYHKISYDMSHIRHELDTISLAKKDVEEAFSTLNFAHNQATTDLNMANERLGTLEIENRGLFTQLMAAEETIKKLNPALERMTEEYTALREGHNALTQDFSEASEANSRLTSSNQVLHADVSVLTTKLQSFEALEAEFTQWLEAVKVKYKDGIMNKGTKKQVLEAEKTIVEMGQQITRWKEFIAYLRWHDGDIKRQGNYKIPLASKAVNYNNSYLGTSKPTLLKFKRETADDNQTVA